LFWKLELVGGDIEVAVLGEVGAVGPEGALAVARHGIPERDAAIVMDEASELSSIGYSVGMVFPFREDEAPCCIVYGL
jgi:hypothetical protein